MIYRFVLLFALTGCFNPKFKEQIACGPAGECPHGTTCQTDGKCHGADPTPDGNGGPIDARPDAAPVGCQQTSDCATPPDLCSRPGTCDLGTHTCTFPAVDCSGQADTCNDAACDPAIGCMAVPAHDTATCAATTCDPQFGPCGGFANTCDSTGTHSRNCTNFTCQSGNCVGTGAVDTQACTTPTNGVSCGASTVTNCGFCGNTDKCAETGTMTCTCTTQVCSGDVCTQVPTSCEQACTRNTDGDECLTTSSGCPLNEIRTLCCLNGGCSDVCFPCAQ